MVSSALSWTKLYIHFNISLVVIAFIFMQISQKYYTLLVITGVVTNVNWALHWQRLQCLNNCKWKQLFMTYPVALRSHLDSSGRVQPFHINLHPLKKGYSPSNTLQNHVEYQFIDFFDGLNIVCWCLCNCAFMFIITIVLNMGLFEWLFIDVIL